MNSKFARSAFFMITGALTIVVAALTQYGTDSKAHAATEFAHIAVAPRGLRFGLAREVETRFIRIRNTGNFEANVTVVPPSAPFSVVAGGGSYALLPGQLMEVGVQFAPTEAGPVRDEMTIQCSNCVAAPDDNIVVRLAGNARGAVAFGSGSPTPTPAPGGSTANALPFEVTAGSFDNVDSPFASITICASGTSRCTTVNDVLIDTGSFGLRIFGSQLSRLGITPNVLGNQKVGECAFFGSGSTWGAISTVDVKMAGEPTITIPIQVMDDTNSFAAAPRACTQGTQLMSSPDVAGLNGLLGVGQVASDAIFTDYYTCTTSSCTALNSPPKADIVPNPVAVLSTDNNGVVVSLPAISSGGERATEGTLFFGIGTRSDNQPGSVKTYAANDNPNSLDYLNVDTTYKGVTAGGFFDSGSNGLFFNDSAIAECSDGSGFYCPSGTLSKSATNQGASGSVSGAVSFSIANADALFNTNDAAFDNLGGTFDGGNSYDGFDWGLPFFFGRNVYVGLAGASSPLGNGPYTAF